MKFLKEYFVFSSSERRGIFLFSTLLLLLVTSYFVFPYFIDTKLNTDKAFNDKVLALLAQNTKADDSQDKVTTKLFLFNPNTINVSEMQQLGLSEKQAKTINNYRNKGGKFYKKEDFKKIYSISQKDYDRLSPYLVFNSAKNYSQSALNNEVLIETHLFQFNPNTINKDSLLLLGFTQKQASNFLNYRNKGGKFYKKEDVQKVYAVSAPLYTKLEPFILIPSTSKIVKNEVLAKIEINTATPEEFKQIKGIGDKLSERIVAFRDKIGGFCSVNHLAEVYGIEQELINNNANSFTVDKTKIKKININTVTINEFYKHPYISFNDARKIVNFREVHGLFTTVNEIRTNDLVKEEVYSKIVNYLVLE